MEQKRILILGIGEAQLNLIRAAKEFGYFTVVCDKRSGMPGEEMVDHYYQADYLDRNVIYEIAVNEKIDGVISNSEPAMLTVSYLVDSLGLLGNSVESIQNLLSKSLFRKLQQEIGVLSPGYFEVKSFSDIQSGLDMLTYPIIFKPSESSGSRGTYVFDRYDKDVMFEVFNQCKQFSRNKFVTIEEFIPMRQDSVFNADVFMYDGEFLWDGWYGGKRSELLPMVPMSKILPPNISVRDKKRIETIVESLLLKSGVTFGEFNVETFITTSNEIFVIEINPRQAGDDIPRLIYDHCGIDLTKLLVSLSVKDRTYYNYIRNKKRENKYITMQVVFPHCSGIYEDLFIHEDINKYINRIDRFIKKGSHVEIAKNAEDSIAYVELVFDNQKTQTYFTNKIERFIYPIIK